MTTLHKLPRGLSAWIIAAVIAFVVNQHAPSLPLSGFLVVTVLALPGLGVLELLGSKLSRGPRAVVGLALGLPMAMLAAGLSSGIGEAAGVSRPLGVPGQLVAFGFVTAVIYGLCWWRAVDPIASLVQGLRPSLVGEFAAFALLPLGAVLGAGRLDNTGSATWAIVVMAASIGVLVVAIALPLRRATLAGLLYSASSAITLASTLRGDHLYGWDIQEEFGVASATLRQGVWHIPLNHDAYASMFSLTVLPASLHSLAGLTLQAFFRVLVPLLLAVVPVGIFFLVTSSAQAHASSMVSTRVGAGLTAALITASAVFPAEMPAIGRQSIALVMLVGALLVFFMKERSKWVSQVLLGFLVAALAFTHYSSSYALAGVLLLAWITKTLALWYQPGTERSQRKQERQAVRSTSLVSAGLVAIALVTAIGWNLVFTDNNALTRPSGALTVSGVALQASTTEAAISASQYQVELAKQLKVSAKWIEPYPDGGSVKLTNASAPNVQGHGARLKAAWNLAVLTAHESIVLAEIMAVLYLGWLYLRRRTTVSIDVLALGVGGLALGVALRVSGTAAEFFNPERGALITSMLTALPVAVLVAEGAKRWSGRRLVSIAGATIGLGILAVALCASTGLAILAVGGTAPGALTATGENIERFTVSTPEVGAAQWLQANVKQPNLVQTDRYGQLVLLSYPGSYNELPEIAPNELDHRAYVYVSRANLIDGRGRGGLNNGRFVSVFHYPMSFLDSHLYVVYSNGSTRVYF